VADEDQTSGDKTEAATQRHQDQARESGQVPVSREVATFASLTAVVLVLAYQSQAAMRHVLPQMVSFLSHAGDANMFRFAQLRLTALGLLGAILPVVAAAVLAGGGAVLLQTNFLLHTESIWPKFSRVNPVAGFKRIFGFNGIVEIVKSVGKLGLLLFAMWIAIKGDLAVLVHLAWHDSHDMLSAVAQPVFHLLFAGLLVQGVVAGADLVWVRFRHARDLRMSRQDVRDELKDTDGNPHVKARIRRIRVTRARKRMMAKVPAATVVITNPTHYAVALVYDRVHNPAPRIVAKGVDSLAARIREIARANNVPLIENPPLARALYRLEIDTEIPADHYKLVAEIIAYVWRLRQPGSAAR
jgi:flagellar biosynthetic protein FlhB